MGIAFEDDTPAAAPPRAAGGARARVVFEDESAPPPAPVSFSSPYAGYDPRVRNAGTPEQRAQHAGDVRTQAREFVTSIPAGVNKGVAMLPGLPADTATSVVDLLGMGYGATRSLMQQGNLAASEEFFTPYDRSQVPLTGEWNANALDRLTSAVGAGPVTQNPNPNSAAGRVGYATGQGLPGAFTGRQLAANVAGGAGQGVVAEQGGGPGAQALAQMLGGRAVESFKTPPHGSPFSREALTRTTNPDQPQGGGFLPDSGGAAAAMPPQLQRVPQEMRGPLVVALMRGDRDLAERVIDAETLPVPIRMMEGQARADSGLMADEFNLRGTDKEIAARFDEQNQALIDNLDTIRREVAPNVVGNDHVQNGQSLIDSYKAYDEPVRAEITAAYKALEDANGGNIGINAKAFVNAANDALGKKLKGRYLPAAVRGDLDQIAEQGGLMTFEQFENLRTNLATAARDADRGALGGGGNAAAAIRLVRDELENMPMAGTAAEAKALADRARSLSKARFDRMRQDPAYEAAVDDPTPVGEQSPFADEFVRKYVVGGKAANLARMRENLANDPIAAETVAAAALNYVKKKSGVDLYTNEGNFSQAGFNRALADIRPRFASLLPDNVAETLDQLGRVAGNLQRQRKGGAFNNSGTFSAHAREAAKGYVEGTANAMLPGANLGTFVRTKREKGRQQDRIRRTLDPMRYLSEPNE